MKRFIIILIILDTAAALWINYCIDRKELLGQELVTNAYYGNFIALKNNVEKNAPLAYEVYLQEPSRQYTNVQFNALHAAASSGNEDIINFLLDKGFEINYPTPDGWTPLFIAIRDGNSEAAKLLIYRGAEVNTLTNLRATPLMMAITQDFPSEKERLNLITYLLKKGANLNTLNSYGFSAVYYAAIKQNYAILETLTQDNPNIDLAQVNLALEWLNKNKADKNSPTVLLLNKLIKMSK